MQMHTEDEEIQAFVWQVFINQYFLLFFRATSQEPNQITVLEFGYQLDFIFELYETLPWMWRKSLHRYLQSLGKLALGGNIFLVKLFLQSTLLHHVCQLGS